MVISQTVQELSCWQTNKPTHKHTLLKTITYYLQYAVAAGVALSTFQSDASAHRRTPLVSDKHVPALPFQLLSPGSVALVCFRGSRSESEWRSYCDWLLAAQTAAASHPSHCRQLLHFPQRSVRVRPFRCCGTRRRTLSHQTGSLPVIQTSILWITEYGKSRRNAFMRNNEWCRTYRWAVVTNGCVSHKLCSPNW